MASIQSDTIEEELSTSARLEKLKRLIEKASKETILEENEDPNSSFHLGMELFGQETNVIERDLQVKLLKLEKDLTDIVDTIEEGDTSTPEANDEQRPLEYQDPADLHLQATGLQEHIAFLQTCSKARAALDESIVLASPTLSNKEEDLLGATKHVLEALKLVDTLEGQSSLTDQQEAIHHDLRVSVRRQKVELIARIQKTWFDSVKVTPTLLSVRNNQNLESAYDSLELLAATADTSRTLDMIIRKFSKSLMEIFSSLLERHRQGTVQKAWTTQESQDRVSSTSTTVLINKATTKRLEWTRDDDGILDQDAAKECSINDWEGTFKFMQSVLLFVSKHIFLERPELCRLVGKRLIGKPDALPPALNLDSLGIESCRIGDDNGMLLEPLMELLASTTIPEFLTPDEMSPKLDSISEELDSFIDPFLQGLVNCNMAGQESTRLDKFVASFEQKYVDNRRCLLLNQARNLLIQNDYHNTVQVGTDAPICEEGTDDGLSAFIFHKCSVSDTAHKLIGLCRQSMEEAVAQPSRPADSPLGLLPSTLYRVARELLDLYRAIIPVTHGKEIKNVPRTAAVHHNDGVFLGHHCLTLGLEYKNRFPEADEADVQGQLLRKSCMFVDMVPLFRNMADRSLKDMLRLQGTQIAELVEPRLHYFGKSLQSDEILAEWSEAESAIESGIYHLRHLLKAWQPVMSHDILDRCMGHLVDIMLTLFLNEMNKATRISAGAAHSVRSLVQHGCSIVQDGSIRATHSRTLNRWEATGKLVGMSLSEISTGLGEGTFRSMTGVELTHLIKAVFPDSPQRRDLLQVLMSHTS